VPVDTVSTDESSAVPPAFGLATGAADDDAPLARVWGRVWPELHRSLRAHSIFIGIIFVHVMAALVLPPLYGVTAPYSPLTYFSTMLVLTGVAVGVFLAFYSAAVAIAVRPKRLWAYLRRELGEKVFTVERLCFALPMLVLFPIFSATFSYFKTAIPYFHPYSWDSQFAEWDRMLHGGVEPWVLLQPIVGYPIVTALLSMGYRLWFGITYGLVLWLVIDTRHPRLRMRYLLTFMLIWMLSGNLAAILLASAGPAFYGRVTGLVGADPFTPLMAYLHAANEHYVVPALPIQEMLWTWYAHGVNEAGAGISAMPSLHVGIAFSFFLLGRAVSRRWAFLGAVYAGIILVSSVHLAWHYAIDGYVAILMTWAIWAFVGWLLERPAIVRLLWADRPPAHIGDR
jgi:PAP2 superfamily